MEPKPGEPTRAGKTLADPAIWEVDSDLAGASRSLPPMHRQLGSDWETRPAALAHMAPRTSTTAIGGSQPTKKGGSSGERRLGVLRDTARFEQSYRSKIFFNEPSESTKSPEVLGFTSPVASSYSQPVASSMSVSAMGDPALFLTVFRSL